MTTKLLVLALALTMLLVAGCEDRGTNVPQQKELDRGGAWTSADHVFSPELRWQLGNNLELQPLWVYVPQVAWDPPLGESRPVPLLILLGPQLSDKFFYARHGLKDLLQEMIADGTIQPMIVACVPPNNFFGGYFYSGGKNFSNLPRPATGNYDAIIGSQLLSHLRNSLHIIDSKQKTGIGGVGMGAYGAFRAALIHDTAFGSVSAVDGPLDFDGNPGLGYGNGLIDLFDDALNEQGLLNGNIQAFDSSKANPLSSLFIGGSFAFSPYDTVYYETYAFTPPSTITKRIDSTRAIVADSSTLVRGFFVQGSSYRVDYNLPFRANGDTNSFIWNNFWMTENLENLIDTSLNKLNGVDLWIASSPETKYNYYQQTQSWINTLTGAPYNYNVTVRPYEGTPGNPATDYQYMYDLLREILIFHSNSFGN